MGSSCFCRNRPLAALLLVFAGGLALGGSGAADADCLFVNEGGIDNSVAVFQVGPDRILEPAPGSPVATLGRGGFGPSTDSIGVFGRRLYVVNSGEGLRTEGSVAGFSIRRDCSLSPLAGSPWPAAFETVGIAIHPRLRRLYVASYREGSILRYAIGRDGALALEETLHVGLSRRPYDLEVSRDGRFLFATHHLSATFAAYRIGRRGTLRLVSESPPSGMFLSGLTVSQTGRLLYAVDYRNSNIVGVSFDRRGGFRPLAGSPWRTVPERAGSGVSDVELTPDDRYLIAANSGRHTLGVYEVGRGGSLSEAPGSPFASDLRGPWGLALSPDGEILVVVNGGRGALSPCGLNCAAGFLIEDGVPIADPAGPVSLSSGRAASALYVRPRRPVRPQ